MKEEQNNLERPKRIDVIELLPELDDLLLTLLENLTVEDWHRPTIVPNWRVKDIAVHLLDGNLRTLSMLRDHYYGEKAENVRSYEDLVSFLNRLNADWVKATRRLSPKVIIEMLRTSGKEYCGFLRTLDPEAKADFSVAWAGENESKNWFHIAREYTEKWHHQQQIRLAIDDERRLLNEKWFVPYLDTSIRALPYHYSGLSAGSGDMIKFTFYGDTEKTWYLRYGNKWELFTTSNTTPVSEVRIKDQVAWKIFTKGIRKDAAIQASEISGDENLAMKVFDMLAVMA